MLEYFVFLVLAVGCTLVALLAHRVLFFKQQVYDANGKLVPSLPPFLLFGHGPYLMKYVKVNCSVCVCLRVHEVV